jgi:hypothetical protein
MARELLEGREIPRPNSNLLNQVAFSMRLMVITILWCVKVSFIMVYYAFTAQLPPLLRVHLDGTTSALFVSY